MKNLILTSILMLAFNANAGEIVNRDTGEYINFNYSQSEGLIELESSANLQGEVIFVEEMNEDTKKALKSGSIIPATSAVTNWLVEAEYCKSSNPNDGCVFFAAVTSWPFFAAAYGVGAAMDLVALPFRAFHRTFGAGKKHKTDFRMILKASFADEHFEVGTARFERIIEKVWASIE